MNSRVYLLLAEGMVRGEQGIEQALPSPPITYPQPLHTPFPLSPPPSPFQKVAGRKSKPQNIDSLINIRSWFKPLRHSPTYEYRKNSVSWWFRHRILIYHYVLCCVKQPVHKSTFHVDCFVLRWTKNGSDLREWGDGSKEERFDLE